jgi:predicted methyltransferase
MSAGLAALLCGALLAAYAQNDASAQNTAANAAPKADAAAPKPPLDPRIDPNLPENDYRGRDVTNLPPLLPPPVPVKGVPEYLNQAVANWSRLPPDVWADPVMKPQLVAQFVGIKPGDKVVDLIPGKMYWSRLFSKIVGDKGYVYPFVPQIGCRPSRTGCVAGLPTSTSVGYALKDKDQAGVLGDPRSNGIDDALETQNITDFAKNLAVIWNIAGQFSLPEQADVVWSFGHWHDLRTWDYGVNMKTFLPLVLLGMQQGGTLVVADYASEPGKGWSVADSLHRMDKETVKQELVAAGFEYVGESNLLANAKDDHKSRVENDTVPENVDMFILKFKKPMNGPLPKRPKPGEAGDWIDGNYNYTWSNSNGTYEEYRGTRNWQGRWFFDASGHMCLWNEYPAFVRGLLGCHEFSVRHYGDHWMAGVADGDPHPVWLIKEHLYPAKPIWSPPPPPPANRPHD